ncbi:phosphotransferase family protein [Gordonia sp. NPDC003376]
MTNALLPEVTDLRDATPTMASPSWWGADSLRSLGLVDDEPVLVRHYTPAARTYLDVATALAAATAAGAAGLAPAVLGADPAAGVMVAADLGGTHATATLGDAGSTGFPDRLFRLRDAVGSVRPTIVRESTVFDDVRDLHRLLHQTGIPIPVEFQFFRRTLDEAEKRIVAVGYDLEFRHGDGNLSNVMISRSDGEPMLVDWDWSAMIDPYQDIGVVLVELADDETHARELFEIARGTIDEALFARAMVYGYADHVRQALIGLLVDALDPGTHEYSKYGDWQLLRARMALSTARSQELLRRI